MLLFLWVPLQIWATQPYCDGNTYAALLNMGEASGSFALDFSTLPSRSTSTKAVVRDLWEHQDLGTFIGTACVKPREGTRAVNYRNAAVGLSMFIGTGCCVGAAVFVSGCHAGSLPSSFVNIPAHGVLALKLTV